MKKLPAEELEYARLQRDVTINEELYTLLAKRFKESRYPRPTACSRLS